MKYILLIFFSTINLEVLCCSCIHLGAINDKQFNSYDLIIKGQIEKIEEVDWTKILHIRIETQFKGEVDSKKVLITTPLQSSMCGISPQIGETWLMFAYKSDDSYSTDLCTRTKNLNPEAWNYNKKEIKKDLKFLEKKLRQK